MHTRMVGGRVVLCDNWRSVVFLAPESEVGR